MDIRQPRDQVESRWLKRRLPAALLAALLTAPFALACSSEQGCDAEQSCGPPGGSGSSGAGGSRQAGGTNANGGASTAGAATGGAFIAAGSDQGGTSTSAGGGGSGNAGTSTGGKSNGGAAGVGGTLSNAGSAGKPGSGGGGASGAGGTGSAGTSGAGGTGSVDPYASARQTCVDRVNTLRATKGLGPIPRLASAEKCADGQAKKDSESGTAHGAFNDCVNQVQGWTSVAQNECPGYGSVASTLSTCIDQMWAEGPGGGHYDNMVGGSDFIACGFYTTPGGKVWMIQDFWSK